MRILFTLLFALIGLPLLAAPANQFPIKNGLLQSDADANGHSWTNGSSAAFTNFIDAVTGLPIGGSSGITPAPGRNIEMTTAASVATLSTITNPFFTSLLITNPAAGGSSATAIISGNTGAGGFSDTITSDPNALGFSLGGSRFVRMPKLVVSGSGATAMVGDGSGITNLVGNGVNVTNVQSPSPLAYLNLQNIPFQLTNRMGVGNLKLMERLANVINYTNILPLASSNTIDTRLIDLLTNSAYGTCVILSNGTYNIGSNAVIMAPGVMAIGQSASNTVIYEIPPSASAPTPGITPRRDCCLANFTMHDQAGANSYTTGIQMDSSPYADNFGILVVNVILLEDTDSSRFTSFNGELREYNCWNESHWDGWVMDGALPGSEITVYNNYHLNDVTKSIHVNPDGDRPIRSAAHFKAFYSTFVAKDTFNPGDADSVCVGPCGDGVFLGDCTFSLTTTSDPAQTQVGQVVGLLAPHTYTIVSGGSYDPTKLVNRVNILQ